MPMRVHLPAMFLVQIKGAYRATPSQAARSAATEEEAWGYKKKRVGKAEYIK